MKVYVNVSPEFKRATFGRDSEFTIEASSIEVAIGRAVRMFRDAFRKRNNGSPKQIREMSVRARILKGG